MFNSLESPLLISNKAMSFSPLRQAEDKEVCPSYNKNKMMYEIMRTYKIQWIQEPNQPKIQINKSINQNLLTIAMKTKQRK